jgi:hypothetical protein
VLVGLTAAAALPVTPAFGTPSVAIPLARQTGAGEEAQGQEGTDQGGGGQGEAEAETGAGGQTEGGSSTESELPWTYQMARLSILLLVGLAAAIGLLYYRLVVKRQRGDV